METSWKARGAKSIVRDRCPRGLLAMLLVVLAQAAAMPGGASAAACANAEFRKGVAAHLPDCRAYEQVSPTSKNGFDVQAENELPPDAASSAPPDAGGVAVRDGSGVVFLSPGAFADAAWGGAFVMAYAAHRGDGRWTTSSLRPPVATASGAGFTYYNIGAFSADLRSSLLLTGGSLAGDPAETVANVYRHTLGETSSLLAGSSVSGNFRAGFAASDDLTHVVGEAHEVLTEDPPGQPGIGTRKIYEYSADFGGLRLVTRQPGTGDPFPTSANVGRGVDWREGAMSEDGEHIFFTFEQVGDNRKVFRRSHGTTTALASPSRRTPPDPEGPKPRLFHLATPDGNRLFFTSAERLTDDANDSSAASQGDLYRYDFRADELLNLTASTPGTTDAQAQGVIGTDESGSRVYFAASGQVGGEGTLGEPNMYLWEDDGSAQGTLRFIATLDSATTTGVLPDDEDNWLWSDAKRAQVTSDGRYVAFVSRAAIGGYGGGSPQVFLYDAEAQSGAGELACVSCPSDGAAAGAALVPTREGALSQTTRPRFVAEDGSSVFFTSPAGLVTRDTNNQLDAYVWDRTSPSSGSLSGEVSLLSTGTSSDESYFHGADADGDTAFFRTRSQLVPQDGDTLADLYAARVGGGLASQLAQEAPGCEGDPCQGAPDENEGAPHVPVSEAFQGDGNASLPVRKVVRLGALTRLQRVRMARGLPSVLRVRVNRPSRVRVAAVARLRGKRRLIAAGRALTRQGGVARVRVRVRGGVRRHLRRQRTTLRVVRVRVNAPGARARARTVSLRAGRRAAR